MEEVKRYVFYTLIFSIFCVTACFIMVSNTDSLTACGFLSVYVETKKTISAALFASIFLCGMLWFAHLKGFDPPRTSFRYHLRDVLRETLFRHYKSVEPPPTEQVAKVWCFAIFLMLVGCLTISTDVFISSKIGC